MEPFGDRTAHCKKCGGNVRLVVFRRCNGKPEWLCAVCTGQHVPGFNR